MAFRIITPEFIIGNADAPEYVIAPRQGGILDFNRRDNEPASIEVDGNMQSTGMKVTHVGAERVLMSGPSGMLDASNLAGIGIGNASHLTEGTFDPVRISGDYSGANTITVTNVLTISGGISGNIAGPRFTSGTLSDSFLDGGYAFTSLTAANVTAASASGNIVASLLKEGQLHPSRFSGGYTFGSLSLTGNAVATTIAANANAASITTGTLSNGRLSGSYTVSGTTSDALVANVRISGQPSGRGLVSTGTNVVSSVTTRTELDHIRGVSSAIQDQLDAIHNGIAVTGNLIQHLDATQVKVGVLDDQRLSGSYTFQNLTLDTANASTFKGNLAASNLDSGTIDPARVSGSYQHVSGLTMTETLSADSVTANLSADDLVSGLVPDARLAGSYAFDSLSTTTANAAWVSGNVHAANLSTGTIPPTRFDFDPVSSNIVSADSNLGAPAFPWSEGYVGTANLSDVAVDSVHFGNGKSMQLDLESTAANVVPTTPDALVLGTAGMVWSNVHAADVTVAGNMVIAGGIVDETGNSLSFDMENVAVNVLPKTGGLVLGTDDRPWESVRVHGMTLEDANVGTMSTGCLPSTTGIDFGSSVQLWGNVHAANMSGAIDGNNTGDVWAQLDTVSGTIEALDGIMVPDGPLVVRFLDDEASGFGGGAGTIDVTANGSTATTIESGAVVQQGNIVPSSSGTRSLGTAGSSWTDLHTETVHTPAGVLGSGNVSTGTVDATGTITAPRITASGVVQASTLEGVLDTASLTGTVTDELFGNGTYEVSNLDVTGNASLQGSLTCGHLLPAGNLVYDLGSPTHRFRDLYVSSGSIKLGNATISEENDAVRISTGVTVTAGVSGNIGTKPTISNVVIADESWTPIDDTALPPEGGNCIVNGTGFGASSLVRVGDTNATSTTFINDSQLRVHAPAKSPGSYDVHLIRQDTKSVTLPAALTYSNVVTWVTGSNLGNVFDNTAFTIQLQATSDSVVTFANVDPLPPQSTLDSATGNLTGNITTVTESTVYSFGVRATDQELQDAILTCLLYYIYVALTSVQLSDVSWAPITQTALDSNSSGYLVVTGQGLDQADDVLVGGTSATSFSKVGSSSLRVEAPSKPRGTYDVSVVYGGNQTSKTLANAVYYSDVPVWSTSAALGNVDKAVSFNFTLEATSDSNIILYENTTALPPQTTLNSTTGALTGNITTVSEDILYNIGIRATDEEFQYANRTFLLQLLAAFKITSIWSGPTAYHSAAISRDGELYMWGNNVYGQLGLGHLTNVWLPTRVTGGSIAGKVVTWVALGNVHTLVLCSDNTVHSCGYGAQGQLGNGGTSDTSTFVEITNSGALSGVTIVSLSAGEYHSLALSSTGLVYGWGLNSNVQLGLGDTTQRTTPVAITAGGLSGKNVISIGAGGGHSVALADDGTVWAWGHGLYGQIGNGTTTNQSTPLNVSGYGALSGKTIVSISARYHGTLALASDSSVLSWGWGDYGQIGDGTIGTNRTTAVDITNSGALNGRTITAIYTGTFHSFAISSDGTVIGWGYNNQYQLLDTTTTNRPTPQIITPLNGLNIASIAGGYHALALSSTSEVYAWARNEYGQVGNGTNTASTLKTITENF
jgi:alpha-tubulin suppressor-like RCC1 family protein